VPRKKKEHNVEAEHTACAGGDAAQHYEPPRLVVHGSLAEATSANVIGTVFDKTISAGQPITSIFGSTSF
jgi:hypothetical protein